MAEFFGEAEGCDGFAQLGGGEDFATGAGGDEGVAIVGEGGGEGVFAVADGEVDELGDFSVFCGGEEGCFVLATDEGVQGM